MTGTTSPDTAPNTTAWTPQWSPVLMTGMWFPPNRGGLGYAASRSGAAVFS